MQVFEVSAPELLRAAMHVCELYDDGVQAREDMRADCLGTPPHLRADLLDHFTALLKPQGSSAGFHQNGDDQVEITSTTTTESSAHA